VIEPLLSVVTPVYNGECFLEENLESWLKQSYTRFEIIMVNDGSTDRSVSVINRYRDRLNIRLFEQENKGISDATLRGIEEATGPYIVLMDQDDIADPRRLEYTAAAFSSGAELIIGDYEVIDKQSERTGKIVTLPSFIHENNLILEQLKRTYILGSALAFRYKGDFTFFSQSHGATDYDIAMKMLLRGYRYVHLNTPVIQYRVHHSNTSANYGKQKQHVRAIFEQYRPSELFDRLVDKGHDSLEIALSLGICYLFQDELEIAQHYLSRASGERMPTDWRLRCELLFYLGVLHFKLREYDASLKHFTRLLEAGCDNPAVLNNIGVVTALSGNYDEGLLWFKKAIAHNPSYLDARRNIEFVQSKGLLPELYLTERLLREVLVHTDNIIR